MEQLREYLLKNGWARAGGIPPLIHGEMAPPTTSSLDKWLDDFESRKLNPVIGFEEIKDGNSQYIQEILAMMSSEKRIPQLDKVMNNATNVRENLLKRGWFAVPVERRSACVGSVLTLNMKKDEGKSGSGMNWKCNDSPEVDNFKEPKDDIDKIFNMLATKKEPAKAGKYEGAVDKVQLKTSLLSKGWYSIHSENKTVDTFAIEPKLLEDVSRTFEGQKSICETLRKAEGNSCHKIDDVATEPHESVDSESSVPDPKDKNTIDVASALEGCIQKTVTTHKDVIDDNAGGLVQTKSTGTKGKSSDSTRRHGASIDNLVQQGWSVTKKGRHQITVIKVPELTSEVDASAAPKRGSMRTKVKGRQSRRDKFESQNKKTTLPKTKSLGKEELTGNNVEAPLSALGASHKKKTLFRRFVRRSRQLMGSMFACGRNED